MPQAYPVFANICWFSLLFIHLYIAELDPQSWLLFPVGPAHAVGSSPPPPSPLASANRLGARHWHDHEDCPNGATPDPLLVPGTNGASPTTGWFEKRWVSLGRLNESKSK